MVAAAAAASLAATVTEAAVSPTKTSFLTPNRILLMNNMSAILAGIALLLCLIVLGIVAMLFTKTETRRVLDRLSFRFLVYALLANCAYSVGYIICVKVNPGFWCTAGVFLIQFWLGITNWFILFIAVNLQLVLVHSVDGLALEKWYVIITVILNLAITLPPAIKGKYGWDPVIRVCWITSSTQHDRLIWQISTQLFWILLAVTITTLSASITIAHLYRHKFTFRTLRDSTLQSLPPTSGPAPVSAKRQSDESIGGTILHTTSPKAVVEASRVASRNLTTQHGFRKVILRISIYPIVMVVLNLVITVADIRISTRDGINNSADYALYAAYYILYGARGIFYAVIAFVDPSVIRALILWREMQAGNARDEVFPSLDNGSLATPPAAGPTGTSGRMRVGDLEEIAVQTGTMMRPRVSMSGLEHDSVYDEESQFRGVGAPLSRLSSGQGGRSASSTPVHRAPSGPFPPILGRVQTTVSSDNLAGNLRSDDENKSSPGQDGQEVQEDASSIVDFVGCGKEQGGEKERGRAEEAREAEGEVQRSI